MAYKRGYASLLLTYALVGYSMLICSANKNYKASAVCSTNLTSKTIFWYNLVMLEA